MRMFKCVKHRHYYHTFTTSLLDKPIVQNSNHFNQILSHLITSGLFRNPFISSKLLLSSDPSLASLLFSQIEDPNVYAWNFMSRIYAHGSSPERSVWAYNSMRRNGVVPDNYTFPFVLKACGRLLVCDKGKEIHAASLKFGFEFDVFVQNCIISMYSLCGMVELARRVFDFVRGLDRDVVTWNSMISGYLQNEFYGRALELFGDMWESDIVKPDSVTLVSALTACGGSCDIGLGRKVHGFVVGSGFTLDVFMGSSLISMYAKCGCVTDARKVFDRMHERNSVCWTSMITGYSLSSLYMEAIELYRNMQIEGVVAEEATIVSVVSACGHLGALDQGNWVHVYCMRNGIPMTLPVRTSFIDMYAKCGDILKALVIFNESIQKDVFSWTVMISGLAMNGKSDEALELFSQMETSSYIKPNEITFLGVLTACSHGGLVDDGIYHFGSMKQTYYLTPHIEHYGCMVDLLGRANLLSEAESFVRAMPIKPDVVIWRSLLFGSWANGNIDLAEFAASKIMEIAQTKGTALVLLSNAYAAASMWSDVKMVRRDMDFHGVRKQPGCSSVEINGAVHEFFVSDTSHPQTDILHETIYRINHLLQVTGDMGDSAFEGE